MKSIENFMQKRGIEFMSKGSKQRPSQVPDKQVEDNWSNIFGSLVNHPSKYSVDVQLDKQSERINKNIKK